MRANSRVILVGLAVLVAGGAVFAMTRSGAGEGSLGGSSWVLTGTSANSFDPATVAITAEFTDTQISGSSGVNRYSGGYTATSAGEFSVGELISTLMAGPEAEMQAEATYIKLLRSATAYQLDGDQLTLQDASGNDQLIFAAAS